MPYLLNTLCYCNHTFLDMYICDVWVTMTNLVPFGTVAASSNYKWRNLCLSICMFVCMTVLCIAWQLFIQSTSHLAGVLQRTQGSAVSSVKSIRWAVLDNACKHHFWGPSNRLAMNGHAFWMGTHSERAREKQYQEQSNRPILNDMRSKQARPERALHSSYYKCEESLSVVLPASVPRVPRQPSIQSTSQLAGVLLRSQGSAV